MSPTTLALLGLLPGFVAGYVGHEFAHYAPLAAAGYAPQISLWPPQVEFTAPLSPPPAVRLAAVAPALLGVGVFGLLVVTGWWASPLAFGIAVGACARLFWLSPADRRIALA